MPAPGFHGELGPGRAEESEQRRDRARAPPAEPRGGSRRASAQPIVQSSEHRDSQGNRGDARDLEQASGGCAELDDGEPVALARRRRSERHLFPARTWRAHQSEQALVAVGIAVVSQELREPRDRRRKDQGRESCARFRQIRPVSA